MEQKTAQMEGVIEEEEVEAPVRARPPFPSAMIDDEADAYPSTSLGEGLVAAEEEAAGAADEDDGVAMRVMTPLERVARLVLS